MNRAEAAKLARAAKQSKAPTLEERFWSKVDKKGPDECWPWMAASRNKNKDAYGAFWMDGRHQPANRIALILSGVEVPPGMESCHRCDNPPCCNPSHLFVGTRQDNNADKVSKKRHVYGEKYWNVKLTDEQVNAIRAHKPPGVQRVRIGLPQQLAEQYGVTRQYISELFRSSRRTN